MIRGVRAWAFQAQCGREGRTAGLVGGKVGRRRRHCLAFLRVCLLGWAGVTLLPGDGAEGEAESGRPGESEGEKVEKFRV